MTRHLTDAEVARRNAEIRREHRSGASVNDLTVRYALSKHQIWTVLRRFGLGAGMPAHLARTRGAPRTEAQAAFLTEIVRRHRVLDKLYPPFPEARA